MLTRSPLATPRLFSTLANRCTSAEELGVGDRAAVAGLTLPVEGDLVAPARLDVAIETVVRHVELATDEPLRVRQVPFEDGVPRLRPRDQLRCPVGPEPFVVLGGLVVEVRPGDQRVGLEPLGRREAPQLGGQIVDGVVLFLRHVAPFRDGADSRRDSHWRSSARPLVGCTKKPARRAAASAILSESITEGAHDDRRPVPPP